MNYPQRDILLGYLTKSGSMSTGARIFFVSSLVITGATVLGVNYYLNGEKARKRANIFEDISRREEQRRANIEQYQRQLQLDEQLRQRDK